MRLLLSGKREDASQLITNAIKEGSTIKDIYLDVFQRTPREIGYLWETDQITVTKEHYYTAATQTIMAQLYSHIFKAEEKNKSALIACIGGELHELGARMVADFFEMDGWDTYYVSANTPADSLIKTIEEQKLDILGLSVNMFYNLPNLQKLIKCIKTETDVPEMKIIIGGRLFTISPELWKKFDVDGYAEDVEKAIEIADQLISA
jgi:methanogenic corrinoid protein MtbC1